MAEIKFAFQITKKKLFSVSMFQILCGTYLKNHWLFSGNSFLTECPVLLFAKFGNPN